MWESRQRRVQAQLCWSGPSSCSSSSSSSSSGSSSSSSSGSSSSSSSGSSGSSAPIVGLKSRQEVRAEQGQQYQPGVGDQLQRQHQHKRRVNDLHTTQGVRSCMLAATNVHNSAACSALRCMVHMQGVYRLRDEQSQIKSRVHMLLCSTTMAPDISSHTGTCRLTRMALPAGCRPR